MNNIRIAIKLPAIITLVGLVGVIVVGLYTLAISRQAILERVFAEEMAVSGNKAAQLSGYFADIRLDLGTFAKLELTRDALAEFSSTFQRMDSAGAARETLQKTYITDNPHPVGEKDKLLDPGDFSYYATLHRKFHPNFSSLQKSKGYYDVFLLDTKGNLVYSVFKEFDFATNFIEGEFRDSGLGRVFRAALQMEPGTFAFEEFRPYAPSNNAPASFIAEPVINRMGETIGVIAFQMPIDRINALMSDTAGISEGGETFLLSADGILQSDSLSSVDATILTRLSGLGDQDPDRPEARPVRHPDGASMLAGITPFTFGGTDFLVVSWHPYDIAMSSVGEIENGILLAVATGCLLVPVLGWLLARTIVAPLRQLRGVIAALARGERTELLASRRGDEIGDVYKSMDIVYRNGLEAIRVRAALERSEAMFMISNRHHELVYMNSATERFFTRNESVIRKRLPAFRAADMLGQSLDIFHASPEHNRKMLEGLDETGRVLEIGFDELHVRLVINRIRAANGEILGTLVEWRDISEERRITRELDRVVTAAANGNFREKMDVVSEDRATRDLVAGMNRVTALVDTAVTEIDGFMQALERGDLTRRISDTFGGQIGALARSSNATADHLARTISRIQTALESLDRAIADIRDGTGQLSRSSERSAAALEEASAAMEEIAATSKSNTETSRDASLSASQADKSAREAGRVVADTISAMSDIERSSDRISQIVASVESLSFQINLLSLNASVEAARAGEAGAGFAVVATEVRSLAGRAAAMVSDIKELIAESSDHVARGVTLAGKTGEALETMQSAIGRVSEIVATISESSIEQTTLIQEVTQAVSQLDHATQQNAAVATENAGNSDQLAREAHDIKDLVAFFQTDDAALRRDDRAGARIAATGT